MVLGLVSLGIAYESITRLGDPQPVAFRDAIFVAVLGLLINLVSAYMLGHGHGMITDIAMGTATAILTTITIMTTATAMTRMAATPTCARPISMCWPMR